MLPSTLQTHPQTDRPFLEWLTRAWEGIVYRIEQTVNIKVLFCDYGSIRGALWLPNQAAASTITTA